MGLSLGGLLKSVMNPMSLAQLAMGPAGWASLATKALLGSIGSEVIQQIGKQLGLPSSMINLAQTAFSAASGNQGNFGSIRDTVSDLTRAFNLSPTQSGNLERAAKHDAFELSQKMMKDLREGKFDTTEGSSNSKGSKTAQKYGEGGFLVMLAEVLGKAMDKKMETMASLAKDIDAATNEQQKAQQNGDKNFKTELSQMSTRMSAYAQELSMLSNATSTSIKTIGESLSGIARKT